MKAEKPDFAELEDIIVKFRKLVPHLHILSNAMRNAGLVANGKIILEVADIIDVETKRLEKWGRRYN